MNIFFALNWKTIQSIIFVGLVFLTTACQRKQNCERTFQEGILIAGQSNARRLSEFGGEYAFALKFGQLYGHGNVRFVNCALGSTVINQWQPNGALMNACIDKARSEGVAISAILFWQGENDGFADGAGPYWAQRFYNTVRGFRAAFGEVPVIFAQLAVVEPGTPSEVGWKDVQDSQASVQILKVKMVRTADICNLESGAHATPDSYPRVAERLAEAYVQLKTDVCHDTWDFKLF